MPVLALDLGNTAVKIAVVERGILSRLVRAPSRSPPDPGMLATFPKLQACAVSVVAGLDDPWRAALRAHTGIEPRWLGRELPLPLVLDYETPATLGADRVAAAYAAFRLAAGAAIVVGAGTALTVDVVDARGVFRGGAIAPGLRAVERALGGLAPALPERRVDPAAAYPGRSTAASIDAGLAAAARGLLKELVASARALAGPAAPVFVSGGDSERAAALVPGLGLRPEPELALRGVALCAEESAAGR